MKSTIKVSFVVIGLALVSACGGGPHGPNTYLTGSGGGNAATSKKVDYANVVKPILVNRCGACHMPGGGLPNWQDYQTTLGKKDKILQRVVNEKSMPPKTVSTITDSERQIIGSWIEAGAPENLGGSPGTPGNPGTPGTPGTPPSPTTPPDFGPIKTLVIACEACHDHGGNSQQTEYPRLAGQQATYLEATLLAFKDHKRQEADAKTFMWGMIQDKDAATITLLAQYFAAKPVELNKKGDASLAAIGKTIFENGDPDHGVTACNACHGTNGEGTSIAPRLAGQHVPYLLKQLAAFRNDQRTEATMMPPIAKALTDTDEKAVANYLQGL